MALKPSHKIILGKVIVGMMSLVYLSFTLALFGILVTGNTSGRDLSGTVFSFVFTMGVFYFPLRYGIGLIRRGRSEAGPFGPAPEESRVISAVSNIDQATYYKLQLLLLYSNPIVLYVTFLGVCFLALQVVQGKYEFHPFLTTFSLFALAVPLITYFQAKKNYRTNSYVNEQVHYQFNREEVITSGETFHNAIRWSSLHKVKEHKHWFLLFNSNQTAMAIPKSGFGSEDDVTAFRELVLATGTPRKELRRG